MQLSDLPEILVPAEVADLYRVTTKTLSNWAAEGIGPKCFYITGRTRRYRKGDVLEHLNGA